MPQTSPYMRFTLSAIITTFILSISTIASAQTPATITGELRQWHRVTLTFDGPATDENAIPNPFLDYRLEVTFTNGASTYVVPGFYAADGDAANTSATAGDKWRVRFTPDATGAWTYTASFRTGPNIALSADPAAGTADPLIDGQTGTFTIDTTNKAAPDFRARGRLNYVGEHYMQFANGDYYLKGGANSPEDLLGYTGFDDTYDTGGRIDNFLHSFTPHLGDFQAGDPTWGTPARGQEIIGAMNYLSSQGMNTVYFITYALDSGDGGNVWPWTTDTERERFDVSKLAQWEILFSHMQSRGLQLHVLLQENENDERLGGSSDLNPIRQLYYRELIARFGHHPVLQWNLGEENDNTDAELRQFSDYIRATDPYDHPITLHTYFNANTSFAGNTKPGNDYYDTILQNDPTLIEATSLQGFSGNYNGWAIEYRERSAAAGYPWVVYGDEQGPPLELGLPDMDFLRQNALWGNLMGGGGGIEWYFEDRDNNFDDLTTEDWRLAETAWEQTNYALTFFNTYLPFWEMEPDNALVIGDDDDLAFANIGEIYALYMPNGVSDTQVDLGTSTETFAVLWFDPRNGGILQTGDISEITGPGPQFIGNPPGDPDEDWAALLTTTLPTPPQTPINLQATAVTTQQINLGWQNAATNAAVVEVWRDGELEATLPGNRTSYEDRFLEEDTRYCYRIRTVNVLGESQFSAESCATTEDQSDEEEPDPDQGAVPPGEDASGDSDSGSSDDDEELIAAVFGGNSTNTDPSIRKIGFAANNDPNQIEWFIGINNPTDTPLTNVVVTDTLNANQQPFDSTSNAGNTQINGQLVVTQIDQIDAGQVALIQVTSTVVGNGPLRNTACVIADTLSELCATATAPIQALPATGETPWWRAWIP